MQVKHVGKHTLIVSSRIILLKNLFILDQQAETVNVYRGNVRIIHERACLAPLDPDVWVIYEGNDLRESRRCPSSSI